MFSCSLGLISIVVSTMSLVAFGAISFSVEANYLLEGQY